jgi:hypothetical protein
MTMTATGRQESAEMVGLFTPYTANPDSIGSILTRAEYRKRYQGPLIVATSSDIALYPGSRN